MPEPVKTRTADPYQQIEDEVRALAISLPPSDLGSTRAIQAVARWAHSKTSSHEAMKEALMLAEKADRIHSKCQECEDGAQSPEVCEHCFLSADDARVARRNVLKSLGVLMRDVDRTLADCNCSQQDVHDYGPCDENCRSLFDEPKGDSHAALKEAEGERS